MRLVSGRFPTVTLMFHTCYADPPSVDSSGAGIHLETHHLWPTRPEPVAGGAPRAPRRGTGVRGAVGPADRRPRRRLGARLRGGRLVLPQQRPGADGRGDQALLRRAAD